MIRWKKQTKKQQHAELVKTIREYLALKKVFCFPVRQGAFAYKGISDLIAVKDGIIYAIEVKIGKDILSDSQRMFFQDVLNAGGWIIVAHSLDDIITWL